MRKQREIRKLSLREVSDATKIGIRYLEALEEDRFEVLPATIFAKGFLRNYSQYVGLDPDEVVNYYLVADRERRADEEDEDEDLVVAESSFPAGALLWIAAALVVAVVLLFVLRRQGEGDASQGTASPPSSAQPAREAEMTAVGTPTAAAPVPAPLDSESAQATVPEARGPQAPLRVTLSFTGDCWVEARVDGKRRVSELRVQGESVQFDAEQTVSLVLGDVGAVRVEINGKPFDGLSQQQGRVETTFEASDFVKGGSGGDAENDPLTVAGGFGFTPASSRAETGRPRVVAGAIE
ncbi:MAG: helix-turn-helix domain-containing protein [Thermoanaerobaculia bacterium]|nr:helix-turn-helix domain-containing protein [Thermoanaerobaculia bacterium]